MCESESENEENSPPRKLRKIHYDQKYSKLWEKEKEYAGWIATSTKGTGYFHCKACGCDLKCGGGKFLLSKHAQSFKHTNNVKGIIHHPPITSMFNQSTSKSLEDKVKSGEIKMACFLAKNNLPFNIADDLKNLVQSVCPDSEVAKQITFGKTKAHAIITNVTGKVSYEKLVDQLRKEKFSLIVDESTDRSTIKHMALIVRTAVDFKVEDKFLCLIPVTDCTAIALHQSCKEFFEKANIPYKENMIGYASDGANNMFGRHLSLATLFAKDIPNLFLMKCIYHSFHLCASYARTLPRGVEDFARDVYSYLKNSPKRLDDYQQFQAYLNIKPNKLLHPSQTRWLSLLPVVRRLLEQLPALKLYFQSAVLVDRLLAANSIYEKYMAPSTELYLEFLSFVLPYFHDLNQEMQSERPKLFILYEQIVSTYKTILECFIKPELMELSDQEKAISNDHTAGLENKILNLDYALKENHLPINEIYLGGNVTALLLQENFVYSMGEEEVQQFKEKCTLFYITSIREIRDRFHFQDLERQRLKHLSILNPQHFIERKHPVKSIVHLKTLFPDLCPTNLTELDREWRLLRNTALPFTAEQNIRVEDFWHHISGMKKGDDSQIFPLLSQFVRKLLVLPHSSANVERLFSAVNLLKTCNRNKLSTDTLQGVLHTKRFINNSTEQPTPTEEHYKLFNKNMYSFKQ